MLAKKKFTDRELKQVGAQYKKAVEVNDNGATWIKMCEGDPDLRAKIMQVAGINLAKWAKKH